MRNAQKAVVAGLVLSLWACLNQESQDQVKDLRILAIRTSPPEILHNYLHSLPPEQRPASLPLQYGITVDALVVDPQGRPINVSYRLCPEEAQLPGCPGYRLRENAPGAELAAMRPLVEPVHLSGPPNLYAGGEVDVPPVSLTFSWSAMDYLALHDVNGRLSPLVLLNPALPSFVVRATVAGGKQEETAVHRFMVNSQLEMEPSIPELDATIDLRMAALLGFQRCTPEEESQAEAWWTARNDPNRVEIPPDVECVLPRTANRNPHLARLLYKDGAGGGDGPGGGGGGGPFGGPTPEERFRELQADPTSGNSFKDIVGPIHVAPRQTITLRPFVARSDHQRYQTLEADTQTGVIVIGQQEEDMAYAWFTTAGSIGHTSGELGSGGPDTTYSVGPDTPNGPAFVWLVIRDQRGGVDWARVDFDVFEEPGLSGGGGGGPFD